MKQLETISERTLLRLALKAVNRECDFLKDLIERFPRCRDFLTAELEEYERIRKELVKVLVTMDED